MIAASLVRPLGCGLLVLALAVLSGPAPAQQAPSANAIALAREIIAAKGSAKGFEVTGPSVIEHAKGLFLQTNPLLAKDLNEVAARLRTEYSRKLAEPLNEAAKVYAASFTEQELKDVLAFYKTPLGQKVISNEPAIFEKSMGQLDQWADKFSEEVIGRIRTEMKKKGHDL
jgi:hypothetical protein